MFDDDDPRMTGDLVRRLAGGGCDGDVIAVGVVHDHPASAYRVQSVVERADPDVLALELTPIAVPLFERYATDDRTPPGAGGEMSAAIRAATTSTVVGIDGPTPAFIKRLAGTLYRNDVAVSTVRALSSGVLSVTKHAVACRIAATLGTFAAVRLPVDPTEEYDCDWSDGPREQAENERTQIRRAESVQHLFGKPSSVELRDAAREAHMADRLASLRQDGTVVAIVGVDHLNPLTDLVD